MNKFYDFFWEIGKIIYLDILLFLLFLNYCIIIFLYGNGFFMDLFFFI